MRDRVVAAAVLALGLSALLYAQAPGVFDTLEADGDARFNGDVVFTTPSGALVSFQSLVNAGVGLPMTIDSDTSTQGFQCPTGMEEITAARGRVPIAVTPSGTLAGTNGDAYTDTDIARRGGTAHGGASGSYTPPSLSSSPPSLSSTPPSLSNSLGVSYQSPTASSNLGVSIGSHDHTATELYQQQTTTVASGSGATVSASNLTIAQVVTGSTTPAASITGGVNISGGGASLTGGISFSPGFISFSPGFISFSPGGLSVSGGGAGNQPHPAPGYQMLWCSFS